MSQVYPLAYPVAYIEGIGIMSGKRMGYQNLPFWERMKRTGSYYKTEEQKHAIISQLNAYCEIFFKAYILQNVNESTCNLVKIKIILICLTLL